MPLEGGLQDKSEMETLCPSSLSIVLVGEGVQVGHADPCTHGAAAVACLQESNENLTGLSSLIRSIAAGFDNVRAVQAPFEADNVVAHEALQRLGPRLSCSSS
jgi:hypothetical protein